MSLLYNLGIRLYYVLILVASVFNEKAKLWLAGRKQLITRLKNEIDINEDIVWVHASSLGEFEQGRSVIEELRIKYPSYKILLTFFSPSGYEIRKDYEGADYIFYLPLDTRRNAKQFIEVVNPKLVFFIKYDYWYNFFKELNSKKIPVYMISAIFRENQIFFKWYGSWYKKALKFVTHFYLQNNKSLELLNSIGLENGTVSGDTRFDRVYKIAMGSKQLPLIEKFKQNNKICVCGSTWGKDEELLVNYINDSDNGYKYIIAPHEVSKSNITRISNSLKKSYLKYSEATETNVITADVIIIDSIGILSSVYRYAEIAYIGGGFGKGIHNTLEAATFGMPIIFGPNYNKFQEAKDLINIGCAYSINNFNSLKNVFNNLLSDKKLLNQNSLDSKNYISNKKGATEIIFSNI